MSENEILNLFYRIFKGNPSFFVKHQAPFIEEKGKLTASWCNFAVYNKHNPPPEGREEGDFIPVTKELYRQHLNGGDGIAIAPLMNIEGKKNVCFYAVIDIDVYGVSFTWLVNRLYAAGFRFAAFLSKSGGLHIYFFFDDPEPADKAVESLKKIVEVYGLSRLFVNGKNKSKVEIFPKQTVLASDSAKAGCLFLPFYNTANKSRQNMLTAEGKLVGIAKALPVIEGMFTSVEEINGVLDNLPYNDAPYCMQAILLSGALEENDGRNDFLFAVAIYMKKKYGSDFMDALQEANDCLGAPLEERELNSIYTSVSEGGWETWSCKKAPICHYCDKKLCSLREYYPGKGRGRFTGADSWGNIYKIMAKTPYYLWDVRVEPEDAYVQVRFESEEELLNQAIAQRRCLRYLSWVPAPVKQAEWNALVTEHLKGVRSGDPEFCRPVPKETDTTEMEELYGLFTRFLTLSRTQNGRPQMILLGQVYYAEGIYYFTVSGITDFLRHQRFSTVKLNLQEELRAYGCTNGEVRYRTPRGEEKVIKCWKKSEDDDLREMSAFYKDVFDDQEDEAVPQKSGGEGSDEGVKF
jgi:hypothetical protein